MSFTRDTVTQANDNISSLLFCVSSIFILLLLTQLLYLLFDLADIKSTMIPKPFSHLLLLSLLNVSAQAITITSPSAGTTTVQANSDFTLRWSVNSTDPPAFNIIVATGHDINTPDKNVSVASNVPTSQLSFPISWHNLAITAGSFCQIALINTTTDTLYAYSDSFKLVQGGASSE